ncbi:transporter substrate-binding domain-containing diguanylate cyclase [Psychromonas ossibalaenae]|uniref:transporter substrate-binding domain-containing diguanylate cyclase n=1 Tax=Psychromonas ossibalaenae TaxID=444922 RepID=UPI00037C483A|nr:transporter substrate-binding domain-containing protein [Psychromonas ossibalaenae]
MIPFILLFRKSLISVFGILVTCLTFSAAAADISFTEQERLYLQNAPVIKVHAEKSWHPFNFTEHNQAKGYSNDLIRLVARKAGLKIQFVPGYHWNDYLGMLENGEIDLITNIKITPEREQYALFTQYNPLKAIDGLLTSNEKSHYADFKYLKDKNIAVVRGFSYEELMRTHYPEINLLLTNSTEESVEQLVLGHVDAVLDSYAVLNYYIQRYFISGVKNVPLFDHYVFNHLHQYMGVHRSNPGLRDILNKGLLAVTDEELVQLQKKWSISEEQNEQFVDTSFQQKMPEFSETERRYLQRKGDLNMCVDPNWLPIEGIRDGQYVGMGADFLQLFKQRIANEVHLIKSSSWTETLQLFKEGKCDFIPVISRSEKRERYLDFSYPYLRFPQVLVTKKERSIHKLEQVLDKPLGIVKDYSYKDVFEENYPQGNLREFSSQQAGLNAVESGEIYGFIDSLPVMVRQIQKYYPELKIADKFEHKYALSLAVQESNRVLLGVFNKVIASISVRQHEEIINRWQPLVYDKKNSLTWLWSVLAAAAVICFIFVWRSLLLTRTNRQLLDMQEKLQQLAMRDTLTGLPNHYYSTEVLNKEWARARCSKLPLSVVMLDIDHFKSFNDQYGRLAGDSCLIELARRLQEVINRPADLLARYSGEEFIVILPETSDKGAQALTVDLFAVLQRWALPHKGLPSSSVLTMSAGCATLVYDDKYQADELLRRADSALFKAQEKGYNQMVQYGNN